jgi:hypothetical protein
MMLASWRHRIDGGIRSGRLYFLLFKRMPQHIGFCRDDRWLGTRRHTPIFGS